MAIWDIGFFDNDMACDWENGLKEDYSTLYFTTPLKNFLDTSEDDLEIDMVCKALAICASVSKAYFKSGEESTYTKHLDSLINEGSIELTKELIELSVRSITRVIESNGELNLYWRLRGEEESWQNSLSELKAKLEEINFE